MLVKLTMNHGVFVSFFVEDKKSAVSLDCYCILLFMSCKEG